MSQILGKMAGAHRRWIASAFAMITLAGCGALLDFDGYEYVDPAQGGAGGSGGADTGCTQLTDCPAPSNKCELRACISGECAILPVAEGEEPEDPEEGDCQLITCDGTGVALEQNDDLDIPVDGNDCTEDLCNSGVLANPPLAFGEPCTLDDGEPGTCDGESSCVQCNAPSDCPGEDTECQTRTCIGGVCDFDYTPNGTAVSLQNDGDCKLAVCDGAGMVTSIADTDDLPIDNNDCTDDLCTGMDPSNPPLSMMASCGTMGTCDGSGNCVGCNNPIDCGPDTFCAQRTCMNNVCGFAFADDNTPLPGAFQTGGDCQEQQCDGIGGVKAVADDLDVPPDDGIECTSDSCSMGGPVHPPLPVDAACTQNNGTVCDGNGACVECNSPGQCNQGAPCEFATCTSNVCGLDDTTAGTPAPVSEQTAGDCTVVNCDGNGGTTNATDAADLPVDSNPCTEDICTGQTPSNPPEPAGTACGAGICDGSGVCNQPLGNGVGCTTGSQCQSGFCVDGFCCNSACTGVCEACNGAKTSGGAGNCSPIANGFDPDNECANQLTCNGYGACNGCGQPPAPNGGQCPGICNAGCTPANECLIDCSSGLCSGTTILCPENFDCVVQCQGTAVCTNVTVVCAPQYQCSVGCQGDEACAGLVTECQDAGACNLNCMNGQGACIASQLHCGPGSCNATCAAQPLPVVFCNQSCSCSPCI